MLKKILRKSDCAKCKFCCAFDNTDFWEIPLFDFNAMNYIKSKVETAEFEQIGNMFRLVPRFNKDGLYFCAALSDNGCILPSKYKPFDCKIWPFRVMKKDDKLLLTLSSGCNIVNDLDEEQIFSFVHGGFSDEVKKYAKLNEEMIKAYIDDYKIIMEL